MTEDGEAGQTRPDRSASGRVTQWRHAALEPAFDGRITPCEIGVGRVVEVRGFEVRDRNWDGGGEGDEREGEGRGDEDELHC